MLQDTNYNSNWEEVSFTFRLREKLRPLLAALPDPDDLFIFWRTENILHEEWESILDDHILMHGDPTAEESDNLRTEFLNQVEQSIDDEIAITPDVTRMEQKITKGIIALWRSNRTTKDLVLETIADLMREFGKDDAEIQKALSIYNAGTFNFGCFIRTLLLDWLILCRPEIGAKDSDPIVRAINRVHLFTDAIFMRGVVDAFKAQSMNIPDPAVTPKNSPEVASNPLDMVSACIFDLYYTHLRKQSAALEIAAKSHKPVAIDPNPTLIIPLPPAQKPVTHHHRRHKTRLRILSATALATIGVFGIWIAGYFSTLKNPTMEGRELARSQYRDMLTMDAPTFIDNFKKNIPKVKRDPAIQLAYTQEMIRISCEIMRGSGRIESAHDDAASLTVATSLLQATRSSR